MKAEPVEFSIVVPVYNSEATLAELTSRIERVFSGMGESYEVVLVDDASQDNSWQMISDLREHDSRIKGVRLTRNAGQHRATIEGFAHCTGELVITLDDDLQHPPEEIPKLIKTIKAGYAVAIARFDEKKHSSLKNLGSSLKRRVEHWLYRTPSSLFISGFKILKIDVARRVASTQESEAYLPAEIYKHVSVDQIANVTVSHEPRRVGRSHYGL